MNMKIIKDNSDFHKETNKEKAIRLYGLLPHGRKIWFCEYIAEKLELSPDYVYQTFFRSYGSGAPKKHAMFVIGELRKELKRCE